MVRKRSCFGLPSSVTKDTSGKLFVCFFFLSEIWWEEHLGYEDCRSFMYTESSFECLGVESWCEDVAAPVILLAWLMVWESFYLRDAMWGPTLEFPQQRGAAGSSWTESRWAQKMTDCISVLRSLKAPTCPLNSRGFKSQWAEPPDLKALISNVIGVLQTFTIELYGVFFHVDNLGPALSLIG